MVGRINWPAELNIINRKLRIGLHGLDPIGSGFVSTSVTIVNRELQIQGQEQLRVRDLT